MKKTALVPLLLVLLLVLTACGSTRYESNDHHFTLSFPDYFSVFIPGQVKADDPLLEEFGITEEGLTAFQNDGGVFYGVTLKDDIYREAVANVMENDYSQEVWQLKKEDTATVNEFLDEIIETFNVNGITALQKGEFSQGKAYCVFVNVSSKGTDQMDAVYMATIYNGKQYAILYQTPGIVTPDLEEEAHEIFDTFYINQTLPHPDDEPKDTTVLKALLVVIMLVIGATVILLVVRILLGLRRKTDGEEQPYVPQFEDITKTKKDKKQ